jgi:hypothetical protein
MSRNNSAFARARREWSFAASNRMDPLRAPDCNPVM